MKKKTHFQVANPIKGIGLQVEIEGSSNYLQRRERGRGLDGGVGSGVFGLGSSARREVGVESSASARSWPTVFVVGRSVDEKLSKFFRAQQNLVGSRRDSSLLLNRVASTSVAVSRAVVVRWSVGRGESTRNWGSQFGGWVTGGQDL
ncbi:uncharacterized protein A4U43_C07F24430 [Asparagus officinalis]|uniref:Uncharacterized protein n=1 Tax=Asparagus officinalis TaxID=4686 RepID=A0A5P1EGJ1_ASPOF|nr:uncharacterized protein A4U43_C07F24430 [Asparagus officinalis]